MKLTKNKKYQYCFFSILFFYLIFNGGNSNLLIQINFIFLSIFFLICLLDKNYKLHSYNFFKKNKFSITLYLFFLMYLVFQILPLPIEFLNFFSHEKYNFIKNSNHINNFFSISLAPTNSYFQILNYINLIVILFIFKSIFYKEKHIYRFHLLISFLGFLTSLVALLFYLNGNPNFYFIQNSFYKDASSGFFINRTVLSVFLLFSLISSLNILQGLSSTKKENFIEKIYIRLFLIFISIGIITTFSRIGNFLLVLTVFLFLLDELLFSKKRNLSFLIIIILVIIFDILILGIYFGTSEIIDRFLFLKEEFSENIFLDENISRIEIIKFSFLELKNYLFFGYGAGAYEILFQNKFSNSYNEFILKSLNKPP